MQCSNVLLLQNLGKCGCICNSCLGVCVCVCAVTLANTICKLRADGVLTPKRVGLI